MITYHVIRNMQRGMYKHEYMGHLVLIIRLFITWVYVNHEWIMGRTVINDG